MQFYPQKNKGFVINHDVAEELEISDELILWEEEYNEAPLIEAIQERFGVEPERVRHFEYSRGGYVQGLQGFDYDSTYVLFDEYTEASCPDEWENLVSILEEKDIDIIEGSWAELGQVLFYVIIERYKTTPPDMIVFTEIMIVVVLFMIIFLHNKDN